MVTPVIKCIFILTFFSLFLSPSVQAESQNKLIAGGCTSEYFLIKDLSESFNSEILEIDPRKTGNVRGLKLLLEGTTDFAFLSTHHKMLAKKMNLSQEKIQNLVSEQIALEPLLIIVHPSAKITNLTNKQVADIFNGEITNWKEVGGANLKIQTAILNKDAQSGLYEVFKMMTIGMDNEFKGQSVNIPDPDISVKFVQNAIGGITFVGHSSYDHGRIEAVELTIDGIQPSHDNFHNGTYPFVAKYFITFDKEKQNEVGKFMDFIRSAKGQEIIKHRSIPVDSHK